MATAEVEFTTQYFLRDCEDKLVLVGNARELGYWRPAIAPASTVREGNHYLLVKLPCGATVEFKWVVLNKGELFQIRRRCMYVHVYLYKWDGQFTIKNNKY